MIKGTIIQSGQEKYCRPPSYFEVLGYFLVFYNKLNSEGLLSEAFWY
jgi:hypothetical protein